MADKLEKKIQKFLTKMKLTPKVMGDKKTTIEGSIETAVKALRKKKTADAKKWIKHCVGEVDELQVYNARTLKFFSDQLTIFVADNSAPPVVDFSLVFKAKSAAFKKITGLFGKKGAATAKQAVQSLHSQMVKSGELPDTVTFEEFDREMSLSVKSLPRLSLKYDELAKATDLSSVMKEYKLPKEARPDLNTLISLIMKHGYQTRKPQEQAKAILIQSGKKPDSYEKLVKAVYLELLDI